jgi:hypothetical protein
MYLGHVSVEFDGIPGALAHQHNVSGHKISWRYLDDVSASNLVAHSRLWNWRRT